MGGIGGGARHIFESIFPVVRDFAGALAARDSLFFAAARLAVRLAGPLFGAAPIRDDSFFSRCRVSERVGEGFEVQASGACAPDAERREGRFGIARRAAPSPPRNLAAVEPIRPGRFQRGVIPNSNTPEVSAAL